jgi:hypothetical protein
MLSARRAAKVENPRKQLPPFESLHRYTQPMQNEDMRWIVRKLVTLKAESEALRKLLSPQHEQMAEFSIVEDWRNDAPADISDILSDMSK